MKQKIMEKLFAEKPLTNEEILQIGSCLDMENGRPATSKYKHDVKDSLQTACGISVEDLNHVNGLIKSEILSKKKSLDCDSKSVEIYEKLALSKPENLRVLMYQFVKMKNMLKKGNMSLPHNITGINLGGNGGGMDDFLNFLNNLRK